RERPVHRVFGGGAETEPVVAEAAPDAAGDQRVEDAAARFVADAMLQVAAGAHVLYRREVAALVMHGREAVAHEFLGDVRDAIPFSLCAFFGWERRPGADAIEHIARQIGGAAVVFAGGIAVVGAAVRSRRGVC